MQSISVAAPSWRWPLALLFVVLPTLWLLYLCETTTFQFDTTAAKQVAKTSWQWAFGEHKSWYVWINLGVIVFPFLLSFDRRVAFFRQWGAALPAVLGTAAFFIPWDVYYTHLGVWGFNDRYFEGLLFGLPYGEWLFFMTVPYACLFVYECLRVYIPRDLLGRFDKPISLFIIGLFALIALANMGRVYTFWGFGLTAGFLAAHLILRPNCAYRGRFYLSYLVCLVPFLVTNGILTGAVNQEPVVIYNDAHNLASVLGGARFITIPFDDFGYGLLLLFMTTTIFEWLRANKS